MSAQESVCGGLISHGICMRPRSWLALVCCVPLAFEGWASRDVLGGTVHGFINTSSTADSVFDKERNSLGIEKGPAVGGHDGDEFDHYNFDGLAGGLVRICVRAGKQVSSIEVNFAGTWARHGNLHGQQRCFDLDWSEYITRVLVHADTRVHGLQFSTNSGRVSQQFGSTSGASSTWSAPPGKHLMGFYGRTTRTLDQIGVYWGIGGGVGTWDALYNCFGCGPVRYRTSFCSVRAGEDGRDVVNNWQIGTLGELRSGFTFMDSSVSPGAVVDVRYARNTITRTERSFSNDKCTYFDFQCDKRFLWQWTYKTNFDGAGVSTTSSPAMLCTDHPSPCCLPYTFSDPDAPDECDLDPDAPNVCGRHTFLL